MSDKPILMTAENYRKIQSGEKSQTRRVCKDDYLFSLTNEMVYGLYIGYSDNITERVNNECSIKENTDSAKRQLQSRLGRIDLLTEKIWELWRNGVRGMVSAKRVLNREGVQHNNNDELWEKENMFCSQDDLHGISWDATSEILAGQTFGWEPTEQSSRKLEMGYTNRKLDGQKSTRKRDRRRETPNGKIDKRGVPTLKVGGQGWIVQPKSCRPCSGNVEFWNIGYCEAQVGQKRWVKEPFRIEGVSKIYPNRGKVSVVYKNDNKQSFAELTDFEFEKWENWKEPLKPKSPLFMFKSLARLWLEVTAVKVERLQDISEDDAIAEGCGFPDKTTENAVYLTASEKRDAVTHIDRFRWLWNSINGKYQWESNPWVWVYRVYTFRKTGGEQ